MQKMTFLQYFYKIFFVEKINSSYFEIDDRKS